MRGMAAAGLALAIGLSLAVAWAAPRALARGDDIVTYAEGTTCTAWVDEASADCGATLSFLQNYRGSVRITIAVDGGSFGFEGDPGTQLDATHYRFEVDYLMETRNDGDQLLKATGVCDVRMRADRKVWESVTCTAKTEAATVRFQWQGAGRPVSTETLAGPAPGSPSAVDDEGYTIRAWGSCLGEDAGGKFACADDVLYAHFRTGRSMFRIGAPGRTIAFGGTELQPKDATHRRFSIDRLLVDRGGDSIGYDAEGECALITLPDPKKFGYVDCRVQTKAGRFEFLWASKGGPAKVEPLGW